MLWRRKSFFVLYFFVFVFLFSFISTKKVKVGIIGAGVGGAGSAYYLQERLSSLSSSSSSSSLDVSIEVFEKRRDVGGRVRDRIFTYEGREYRMELGGSVYHTVNRLVASLHEEIRVIDERLSVQDDTKVGSIENMRVGWWDGNEFVFQTLDHIPFFGSFATAISGLIRYGTHPITTKHLVADTVDKFLKIYEILDDNTNQQQQQKEEKTTLKKGYKNVQELYEKLGLFELSEMRFDQFMEGEGVEGLYLSEITASLHRCNYGQDNGLNAFVALVSLSTDSDDLHSVSGGNTRIIKHMLGASGAQVHLNSKVTHISTNSEEGGYWLSYQNEEEEERRELFDVVVVAAPLELASIRLSEDIKRPSPIKFQITHVTIVIGTVNPKYFGKERVEDVPHVILTTQNDSLPFSSFAAWKDLGGGLFIYKIFSREEVSDESLNNYFQTKKEVFRMAWHAYPVLNPNTISSSFVLQDPQKNHNGLGGIYYVNAMETIVSTIETEALASLNVVNLMLELSGLPVHGSVLRDLSAEKDEL